MKYLFIDTSSSFLNIALISDNNILFKHIEETKNDMSSKIVDVIDKKLKELNISINEINKIFVVNGPGSFTGVRIGVTVAKVIAWALKIQVVPVSSLEFLASTSTNKKYIVPMIDARRGNVFSAIYDSNLNNILNDQMISLEEIKKHLTVDHEIISYNNIESSIKPEPDVIKIIEKYKDSKGINPHKLVPNYLKLTEAEENLNRND